jgi:lycopene elongase/hydratase (dihydrobisanhydrobacterioruberin-forming)
MPNASFPIRSVFQRMLGRDLLAYLLHLRPMEWPIMTGHFLLGTLIATGFQTPVKAALAGWFIFVLLMNGGTLAINSAFDQDEGDVGYLRQPPKPPKYLLHVSAFMLALSLGLGFLLPTLFAWCNAACIVMSILYSVPPARLKARAGWDLLINCLGFGFLTPLAGWGLTGRPLAASFVWMCAGFACLFGTFYPMTQIYQIEEDRARGDRTLVIQMGAITGLLFALLLSGAAHACFVMSLVKAGRPVLPLGSSLLAWLVVLVPWLLRGRTWTSKQHEAGMYYGLGAWAITDVCLLLLLWPR